MSVLYEKRGRVAIVTINRPEAMNAIDVTAGQELINAWLDFRDDPGLWVAVLTGAGEKAFCAGADLKGVAEYYSSLTPIERRERSEREPGIGGITRNLEIWKPLIAAINGHCLAGGLEIALACDLRIAAEHATLGLPEVRWGIMPGGGGTQRLPRAVPLAKAMEMILTGDPVSAQEALRIGLVNKVVPLSDLMPEALRMAARICENGPLSVRAAKEAILRGLHLPLTEGLRLEQFLAEPVRQSEDAREGPRAFLEKRRPQFKGR